MMCDENITVIRFRELVNKEKSRESIAKKMTEQGLNCNTSTITKHYNGDRTISTEYVIKYAKYFGVSTDYLLGLSDVASTDIEIKAICEYTGLTEEALKNITYEDFIVEFTNDLFTNNNMHYFIVLGHEIDKYLLSCAKEIGDYREIICNKSYKQMSFKDIANLYSNTITDVKSDYIAFKLQKHFNDFVSHIKKNHFPLSEEQEREYKECLNEFRHYYDEVFKEKLKEKIEEIEEKIDNGNS
ncbi:MAG: helix-turn-helix domain-containing protein [Ruminococcus sp.]|nr:helix-turn-helix domain-containing protein [Ruminococcus sp.]